MIFLGFDVHMNIFLDGIWKFDLIKHLVGKKMLYKMNVNVKMVLLVKMFY